MIRKTMIGLAAAAALTATAATATTANAGVKVYLGFGHHGWHHAYYGGYFAPRYVYACPKVFVGYKQIWTSYGWYTRAKFKRICY